MKPWVSIVRKVGTTHVGYVTAIRAGDARVMFYGDGDWSGWCDQDELEVVGELRT